LIEIFHKNNETFDIEAIGYICPVCSAHNKNFDELRYHFNDIFDGRVVETRCETCNILLIMYLSKDNEILIKKVDIDFSRRNNGKRSELDRSL
jgi:hypothetical protein